MFRSFFKRLMFLNLVLALFLTASVMIAPAEAAPYQIGSAEQFNAFRTHVESYGYTNPETKIDAELTEDITIEGWTGAIGAPNVPYNGTFNGNGHTITIVNEGLTYSQSLSLFQVISTDAVVQNLLMDVTARAATEYVNLGLISPVAILNYGVIKNITVNCAIRGTSNLSGAVYANYGRIEYVTVNGWIEGSGDTIAGIASRNYPGATISHCVNNAAVTGKGYSGYIAGLVAELNGRLEYSANHGDVQNMNGYGTGGLAGILNSFAIAGVLSGDIYNCYNAGSVSGPGTDYYIGGLVGGNVYDTDQFIEGCGIVNSFNYGTVMGGSAQSAAIIGTINAYSWGMSGVTESALASSQNVYYLESSASLLFGAGSPAENATGISDKFMAKNAAYFSTMEWYDDLIAGPGGTVEGSEQWVSGKNFPNLAGLGDMPEVKPIYPFDPIIPEDPKYPEGFDTAEPMIINSKNDLLKFAEIIKDGGNYQDAILSADLTLDTLDNWTSIAPVVLGSGETPPAYRGTFDGKGHIIEIKKTGSIARTALFYSIGTGGVVKDLVVSLDIAGSSSSAAGVAIEHGGRIEGVKAYGRIVTSGGDVGGIVAETTNLSATISECANYASITAGYHSGGIAARFSGIMEYSANYGYITARAGYPSMGGLNGSAALRGGNTYSNVYNAGTVSAPDNLASANSVGLGGLWGFAGLYGQYADPDYPGYFRSYGTNIFSYGDVLLKDGKGAVVDGGKFGEALFDHTVNLFYRISAGSRMSWAGGAEGDDGWGSDYVKTKITGLEDDAFTNSWLVSELNRHETGKYPDGSPRWVQGEKYPELWVFRQDLPKPKLELETGSDGEVIVPTNPGTVINDTETVTVPAGTITPAIIEAAIEAAAEAETVPTLEIKIDQPVDEETGESIEVNEVKVAIPVSELQTIANSDVENVKIASDVGEVTLNTDALKDLIKEADDEDATTVEVVIAKEDETRLAELTEEQQETLTGDTVREIYDVSLLINEAKVENFETETGKLTIGLPYTLKTGEAGDRIWVYHVAKDGTTQQMNEGRQYDNDRGMAFFTTSHLSVYAVTYIAATTDPGTDDPDTDDPGTDDPGTDDPGTDDPGTDDPGTDDPGTNDPETPDIDDDGAVILPVEVKGNVSTGVATVTISTGSITQTIIDAAIKAADANGTEPTIVIKIDKPVDVSGQPIDIKEVRVAIPVSDLRIVADSEVKNIKIASNVGEVTLNTDAMKDLIEKAQGEDAATVEVVIAKEDEARLEELTEAQQETLSGDTVREVYDVSLFVNNAKLEDFETTGKLTIGLPYTRKTNEVDSRVGVIHVAEDGTTQPQTGVKYERGLATFTTNHLSVYAVTYIAATDDPGTDDPGTDDPDDEMPTRGSPSGGCSTGAGMTALLALGLVSMMVWAKRD